VGKGQITSWSCDPSANGYTPMNDYVLGLSGEELTELTANGGGGMLWQNTNVYAAGTLIATYDTAGLHFLLNDMLGTRRAQTDYAGVLEQTCSSLPFGDTFGNQPICTQSDQSPNALHFTGKERDAESGLDHFQFRSYSSNMGRWMSPDPAGMMAADIEYPQTLNRYAYVNNNPLSFVDPLGLDCAYLNDSGTAIEQGGLDQHSSAGECGKTGGYWVDGSMTNAQINANAGTVQLTGTNDGTDTTHASYQDTSVYVGMYQNTWTNPFGHIAMAFPGQTPLGFNPKDDSYFQKQFALHQRDARVPGAVKPQVGGQLKQTVRVPVTGMQAQMIQNAIQQSTQNPGNYTLGDGNGCDCGTWAQQMLGDAGINSGSSARLPSNLMNQLQQLHPPQQ
jgi:RHS repeat-associated protein